LRRAAQLLGAGSTYACDTDAVAVEIAGQAFVGSVDAVASRSVDLAMANISPEAVIALAPDLRRVLRPGGVLLASGFELHEIDEVRAAFEGGEVRRKGNWGLIVVSANKTA